MNNNEELIKNSDIGKIAEEGAKIYEKIKSKYEPVDNDKFLAIDIDSEDVFIGDTSSEVVELARKKYPDKVFYVVKVGSSVSEILAKIAEEIGLETTHTHSWRNNYSWSWAFKEI